MVLLPCRRLAEKLVELPLADVVVRFLRSRYDAAADGMVVILASPAGAARLVPEDHRAGVQSALGETVSAEISAA